MVRLFPFLLVGPGSLRQETRVRVDTHDGVGRHRVWAEVTDLQLLVVLCEVLEGHPVYTVNTDT